MSNYNCDYVRRTYDVPAETGPNTQATRQKRTYFRDRTLVHCERFRCSLRLRIYERIILR